MKRTQKLLLIALMALLAISAFAQDHVYVLGHVNGINGWYPYRDGVNEMTYQNGSYVLDATIADTDNGYGYFNFSTYVLETSPETDPNWNWDAAWGAISSSRLGAEQGDKEVDLSKLNETQYRIQAGENSFKVRAGRYILSLDLANRQLSVRRMYLIGHVNGDTSNPWNTAQGVWMPWNGRVFSAEVYVKGLNEGDPNGYFTMATNLDGNWDNLYLNGASSATEEGNYVITPETVNNGQAIVGLSTGSSSHTIKIPAGFYFLEVLDRGTLCVTRHNNVRASLSVPSGDVNENATVEITSNLASMVQAINPAETVTYEYSLDGGATYTTGNSFVLTTLGEVDVMARVRCGQIMATAQATYHVLPHIDVETRWPLNAENFPDEALRAYLSSDAWINWGGATANVSQREIAARGTADILGDIKANGFTRADLERVTRIEIVNNANVADLTGVELFPNLDWLVVSGNTATTIDLSGNPRLTYVDFKNSANLESVTLPATTYDAQDPLNLSLDLSHCAALATLDVSHCTTLNGLNLEHSGITEAGFTFDPAANSRIWNLNLNYLQWANVSAVVRDMANLGILSVSHNSALNALDLSDNGQLWDINVDHCENLSSIDLAPAMPLMYALTIADCPKLGENDPAYTLNINAYPTVQIVHLPNIGLKTLAVDQLTSIELLDVNQNSIPTLDVSECSSLETLECASNWIMNSLTLCPSLKTIKCNQNNLSALAVEGCPVLEHLECWDNYITSLNLAGCSELNFLGAADNRYLELDVTHNAKLTWLDCYNSFRSRIERDGATDPTSADNSIATLDVSQNSVLTYLRCGDNHQIVSLDVTHNPVLKTLSCEQDRIRGRLNTDYNPVLETLVCWENLNIDEIDVSSNPLLKVLECGTNKLTSIDVSANPLLEDLSCENNNIRDVKVRANRNLTKLVCNNNNLYELDVTNNSKLRELHCNDNHLNALNLGNNPIDMTVVHSADGVPYTINFSANHNGRRVQAERAKVWGDQYVDFLRLDDNVSGLGDMNIKGRIDSPLASFTAAHGEYYNDEANEGFFNTSADFVLTNVQNATTTRHWSEQVPDAPNNGPRRANVVKSEDETFQWRDAHGDKAALEVRTHDENDPTDKLIGTILVLQEGPEGSLASEGRLEYHYATGNAAVPYVTMYLDWEASQVVTSVLETMADKTASTIVASRTYYSLDGRASSEPYDGVNVVVTTYSDGHRDVVKQVVK